MDCPGYGQIYFYGGLVRSLGINDVISTCMLCAVHNRFIGKALFLGKEKYLILKVKLNGTILVIRLSWRHTYK